MCITIWKTLDLYGFCFIGFNRGGGGGSFKIYLRYAKYNLKYKTGSAFDLFFLKNEFATEI